MINIIRNIYIGVHSVFHKCIVRVGVFPFLLYFRFVLVFPSLFPLSGSLCQFYLSQTFLYRNRLRSPINKQSHLWNPLLASGTSEEGDTFTSMAGWGLYPPSPPPSPPPLPHITPTGRTPYMLLLLCLITCGLLFIIIIRLQFMGLL